ncbi:MAG: NADH:ubiquinone reductase (Na(+)-transporting) subunit B [Planctomycetota bacterium]|nr:MAG: NADH:ubiquinone reductase (Na(+)-transporting) subunit B [Planctomycetota bacterium]
MKLLLDIFEKSKPLFTKGGKLEKLYPLYEAKDTFLFTPGDITTKGAHVRDQADMKRMMISVVVALIPCILFGMYNAGHQHLLVNGQGYFPFIMKLHPCLASLVQGVFIVLPVIIVSYAVGGIWEVIFSIIRKHEINEGFLVTGMLFALVLPPTIPLWQVAVGVSFGVVIGKEIFGGTGMNFLNPALTARAFLFFSYAGDMTGNKIWTSVIKEDVQVVGYTVIEKSKVLLSGFSGETPLLIASEVKETGTIEGSKIALMEALSGAPFEASAIGGNFSFWNMFVGNMGGSIGETSALACLLGAIFLLIVGVASFRIMAGMIIGVIVASWAGCFIACFFMEGQVKPFFLLPSYYHLVMGGFAFGCVFMATDPVSAAATNTGKWIYGLMIGVIVYIVRILNPAYPEGVMLAILFCNMLSPYIDHFVVKANIKRRLSRGS